jgi:SM-20-related protein
VREAIRGDQIQWIDPGQAEACDRYLAAMDSLRQAINQGCSWAGGFRVPLALYPPGAFYRRHLDRFRDDDRRMVSACSTSMKAGSRTTAGSCACSSTAMSSMTCSHRRQPGGVPVWRSPHEVLPAGRERLSLTGWFRRRGNDPF